MSASHTKTFLRGSGIYIAGNVAVGLLNYLVRRTMALNLSEIEYGFFYSVLALISLIMAFTDLGVGQAGTVLVAESSHSGGRERVRECFSAIFWLKLLMGVCAFAGVFLLHKLIIRRYLGEAGGTTETVAFLSLSVLLFSQVCETAFSALWNGLKKFFVINLVSFLRALCLFLLILLWSGEYTLRGAAFAYMATSCLFLAVSFLYAGWSEKIFPVLRVPKAVWKRLAGLIGFIAFATLMLNMIFHMDTVMLTVMKGVESSAIYNIALPVAQLVFAPLVFATVFLPIAVSMAKERKYKALERVALLSILITFAALPFVAGGMYLLAPWLVGFLFDQKFVAGAAPVLPVLAGGFLFYALGNMIMQMLIAFKSAKAVLITTSATGLCNFLFNLLLIAYFDVVGAAWATCLSYFVFCVLTFIFFLIRIEQYKKAAIDESR